MKWQQALTQALNNLPQNTCGLVVAFSGGRDSSALLHLLAHESLGVPVRAVHVCHHIEAEAERWVDHCQRQCRQWGVHFECLHVTVRIKGRGMEAAARDARYDALRGHVAEGEVLVTAHHVQDQAETFLLQALRGAGVSGLAAMPGLSAFGRGRLWRPWLAIERQQITDYARANRLDWIEDGSNADPRYARARLRKTLWPELVDGWPAAATTLARSAAWAGQAAQAVSTLARMDLEQVREHDAIIAIERLQALSLPRQSEVIRKWLEKLLLNLPDHRHIQEILRMTQAREHGGPRVAYGRTEIRKFAGCLFAMPRLPAAPAPGLSLTWSKPGRLPLPAGCGHLEASAIAQWPTGMHVTFGGQGIRVPKPDGHHEPLSEIMRRLRVPPWIRQRAPHVFVGDTLLEVPNFWRHPDLPTWFKGTDPVFVWHHRLVGDRMTA